MALVWAQCPLQLTVWATPAGFTVALPVHTDTVIRTGRVQAVHYRQRGGEREGEGEGGKEKGRKEGERKREKERGGERERKIIMFQILRNTSFVFP